VDNYQESKKQHEAEIFITSCPAKQHNSWRVHSAKLDVISGLNNVLKLTDQHFATDCAWYSFNIWIFS